MADFLFRRAPWASVAWNSVVMVNFVRLVAMRRVRATGLEHLPSGDVRLIMVANHRSFFDFFVTGAVVYARTAMPRRVMFPVRNQFFYDTMLGGAINAVMAGFTMFPPIVRDADRGAFNRFAVARCAEFLSEPARWIGMHPEGKRGMGPDPYEILPVQPGVGRLVLAAPGVVVVPVWIHGLSNSLAFEARVNWTDPSSYPIDIDFGPPVALADLMEGGDAASIADRCRDAMVALAEAHRARRGV